ncbi:MAG: hypothetical protein LUD46_20255 [Parabacteroides sp.]|nr:hypothetical protein [Parabacteroides sp.]
MTIRRTLLMFLLFCGGVVSAQEPDSVNTDTTSVRIYYRVGRSTLDTLLRDNGTRLREFGRCVEAFLAGTTCRMQSVRITSGASPEGGSTVNDRLAKERAKHIGAFLRRNARLDTLRFESQPGGVDWKGLERLVAASEMPYKEEVLDIMRNTPEWIYDRMGKITDGRKRQLMLLRGGHSWHYMEEHFFPELRYSAVSIFWDMTPKLLPRLEPLVC